MVFHYYAYIDTFNSIVNAFKYCSNSRGIISFLLFVIIQVEILGHENN